MKSIEFSFNDVISILKEHQIEFVAVGDNPLCDMLTLASINDATENSMIFIDKNNTDPVKIITESIAPLIICSKLTISPVKKCLLCVDNPKYVFAFVVNKLLKNQVNYEIHATAIIHPEAVIDRECYIGPNTYIGKCVVGKGTIIYGNCYIYDNVSIGQNVIIDAGCCIGAAGFGFVRDDKGVPLSFPQLGGVIIEDDVEIGANTCIDKGTLNNTIIKRGVKIDNLVQIAHNVIIDEYTYVMSQTAIAGSVTIGKRCWIAPSKIINKIHIGDDVTVGFGAVVFKSIPASQTYIGYPAININRFGELQYKLKKL